MEEKKARIAPIAMRYGAIGGLLLIALGLILKLTGLTDPANQQHPTNWIGMLLGIGAMVYFLVMAVRTFTSDNNGFVSFGRAFSIALLTAIVMSVISMIWTYVDFAFVEPDMIDRMREMTMNQLVEARGMDESQAEDAIGRMGWFYSPIVIAVMGGFFNVLFSVVIALIVAAIMKKNPPEETVM